MPSTLAAYLALVPEFKSQERVYSLYSDFASKRASNPVLYEANARFWRNLILELSRRNLLPEPAGKDAVDSLHGHIALGLRLDVDVLMRGLARAGIGMPASLTDVLVDMVSSGDLETVESAMASGMDGSSWSGWMFSQVSFLLPSYIVNDPRALSVRNDYVVIDTIKALIGKVLAEHRKRMVYPRSDLVYSSEDFQTLVFDAATSSPNGRVSRTGVVAARDVALVIVKFIPEGAATNAGTTTITDADRQIAHVRRTVVHIMRQIAQLEESITTSADAAHALVRKGRSDLARIQLGRQRALKAVLEKRHASLAMLERVWSSIQQAESDAHVLAAYESGTELLKSTLKGVSAGRIDNLRNEMEDVMADQKEIEDAIAGIGDSATTAEADEEQLEEELEALLQAKVVEEERSKAGRVLGEAGATRMAEAATAEANAADLAAQLENLAVAEHAPHNPLISNVPGERVTDEPRKKCESDAVLDSTDQPERIAV